MSRSALYESDFHAWAKEQAALLRAGKLMQADIDRIAEEIDSMGRTEKRELVSRLTILLLHLLKWRFQPTLRGRSWRLSVEGQRLDVESHLADNPSLKAALEAAIAQAYRRAAIDAQRETGLDAAVFPVACPWSFDQIMDPGFWPDAE
ncbi:MAG: DUF29 domain-containing protein [Methylocystaceae bacterium]|nr:MAG: DUF29 domain-containing protein [Methylocystaceae bacterium]